MPCGCKHKKKRKRGSGVYVHGGGMRKRKKGRGLLGRSSKTWAPKGGGLYQAMFNPLGAAMGAAMSAIRPRAKSSSGPVRRFMARSRQRFGRKQGSGASFSGSGISFTGSGMRRVFRSGPGRKVI